MALLAPTLDGERAASKVISEWKGTSVFAACNAAYQIGMIHAGGLLAYERAKNLVEINFDIKKIDKEHLSKAQDAFQSGRSTAISSHEVKDSFFKVAADDNNAVSFRPTPFVSWDAKDIPLRDWIYGRFLLRGEVAMTIAAGAVGKSSLKIVEALALVTGRDLLGIGVPKRSRVWYFNLEDSMEEMQRRFKAAMLHYNITQADIAGWLFIEADKSLVITKTTRDGTTIALPVVAALVAAIKELEIDVFMIDPFISTHDAPESDNGAMDRVMKQAWKPVAREGGCAVNISHHTVKTDAGMATSMSGRGAGAIPFAGRSAQVLNPMSDEDAKKAGLDSPDRYFSEINDKENMSPKNRKNQTWYKFESVFIGNCPGKGNLAKMRSDSVGVVTRWYWPSNASFTEGVSDDQLQAIKNLLKVGEHRKDNQSAEWAGYAAGKILGLGTSKADMKKDDRRSITHMLDAWVNDGHLKEYTIMVDSRKKACLTTP
jgi:AAA domain-containing protein